MCNRSKHRVFNWDLLHPQAHHPERPGCRISSLRVVEIALSILLPFTGMGSTQPSSSYTCKTFTIPSNARSGSPNGHVRLIHHLRPSSRLRLNCDIAELRRRGRTMLATGCDQLHECHPSFHGRNGMGRTLFLVRRDERDAKRQRGMQLCSVPSVLFDLPPPSTTESWAPTERLTILAVNISERSTAALAIHLLTPVLFPFPSSVPSPQPSLSFS